MLFLPWLECITCISVYQNLYSVFSIFCTSTLVMYLTRLIHFGLMCPWHLSFSLNFKFCPKILVIIIIRRFHLFHFLCAWKVLCTQDLFIISTVIKISVHWYTFFIDIFIGQSPCSYIDWPSLHLDNLSCHQLWHFPTSDIYIF